MAERTAAQKAATRRMIAANRRAARGGGSRRSGGRARGSIRSSRRGVSKVKHVGQNLGKGLIAAGIGGPDGSEVKNLNTAPVVNVFQRDPNLAYRVLTSIPLLGQGNSARALNRAAVGAGAVIEALPTIKKLPVVGGVARRLTRWKSGKKTIVLGA